MSILRTIECDICYEKCTETKPGEGWPGWGALQGIVLNDVPNPSLCPNCLSQIAMTADNLANLHKRGS